MAEGAGVAEGPTEFLFDVETMTRMADAGVFDSKRPIELRRGKLIERAPIGGDHGDIDGNVHRLLWRLIAEGRGDIAVAELF